MLTQINELYRTAKEADDIAAIEFISELLSKKVIDVGYYRKLVFRVKNNNVISSNIEHLDYVINDLKI